MLQQVNEQGQGHTVSVRLSRTLPITLAGVLAAMAGVALPAAAQDTPPADTQSEALKVTDAQLLDDFAHYVMIVQNEMAHSVGEQLLSRGLTNVQLMELVDAGDVKRFEGVAESHLNFLSRYISNWNNKSLSLHH